jgi:hypothetical protein
MRNKTAQVLLIEDDHTLAEVTMFRFELVGLQKPCGIC